MSNESIIWNYLKSKGFTDIAVAGIMGNLYAESGLLPNNLQNNYEAVLGMNNTQYTNAVDNGSYTNFVNDAAGYGLAQWTFWSRKQGLLTLAIQRGKSVGDLTLQLDFLYSELNEFNLTEKLNRSGTVKDASNIMLFEFEKPYDTGTVVQNARAKYSQDFYNQFHGTQPVSVNNGNYCVLALKKCNSRKEAENLNINLMNDGFQTFVTTLEF